MLYCCYFTNILLLLYIVVWKMKELGLQFIHFSFLIKSAIIITELNLKVNFPSKAAKVYFYSYQITYILHMYLKPCFELFIVTN